MTFDFFKINQNHGITKIRNQSKSFLLKKENQSKSWFWSSDSSKKIIRPLTLTRSPAAPSTTRSRSSLSTSTSGTKGSGRHSSINCWRSLLVNTIVDFGLFGRVCEFGFYFYLSLFFCHRGLHQFCWSYHTWFERLPLLRVLISYLTSCILRNPENNQNNRNDRSSNSTIKHQQR